MNLLKQLSALATFSLLVFYSASAQQIDQTFSEISKIEISTGSSDCVIKQGSDDIVNVKLEHTYGDSFKPTVEKSGSKLVISEKGARKGDGTWTLSIPNGLDVSFNTGSGDFRASNLEVGLKLNAGSGDFSLHSIQGDITSNTGSGDLELDELTGDITANAGSGDMGLKEVKGTVKLNSGSGDMDLLEIEGGIKANVGSGDIAAKRVQLLAKSGFNSGSGDVSVSLGESLKHDISVNSGSGDAELNFNGSAINGTVVMTANKRNGEIHAPFDFDKEEEIDNDGNITLKKTARLGDGKIQIKVGTGSGDASIGE